MNIPQTHEEIQLYRFMYDIIFQYLSYRDALALLYAIPRIYQYMDKRILDVEELIKREFAKSKIYYDNFVSKFQQYSNPNQDIFSIAYGGMILGIFRSKIYRHSDIDFIHYQTTSASSKCFPLEKITINTGPNSNTPNQDRTYTMDFQNTDSCYRFSYPLTLIKTEGTSKDMRMYQHNTILYEASSISEYLDNNIDLELTKIYYDGKKIRIKNIDLIFNEKEDVNVNKIFKKTFELYMRINGIEEKKVWDDDNYDFILERIHDRIKKYIKRGFKINYDQNSLNMHKVLKKTSDKYHLVYDPKYLADIYQRKLNLYRGNSTDIVVSLETGYKINILNGIFAKYLDSSSFCDNANENEYNEKQYRYRIDLYDLSICSEIMEKIPKLSYELKMLKKKVFMNKELLQFEQEVALGLSYIDNENTISMEDIDY